MKIGSDSNALPGCAPTPDNAAPATGALPPPLEASRTPNFPPPSDSSNGRQSGKNVLLAVVLLVIVVTGVLLLIGQGNMRAGVAVARKNITKLATQYLPGMGAGKTNQTMNLTPAQQKFVADYSPAIPIKEAKRVKAVAGSRVRDQGDGEATNAESVAVATADAGPSTPAQSAATPAAAPDEPRRSQPTEVGAPVAAAAKPTAAAMAKPVVWPAIKITAVIAGQHSKSFARINGRLVSIGDTFDNMTVVAISPQYVTMSSNGQERDFYVGTKP